MWIMQSPRQKKTGILGNEKWTFEENAASQIDSASEDNG